MGFPGLRFLHPFDSYRARKVREELAQSLKFQVREGDFEVGTVSLRSPVGPVSDEQLEIIHTPSYLHSLRHSWVVARAIEVPAFSIAPRSFLNWCLVKPMRWAVAGTLLGAREALRTGLAFSLTGGFHHAKAYQGEGFCLFNDIAYAIRVLQQEGQLETVAYVDLDAHQGNGVCQIFQQDSRVRIFDIYNDEIYPQEPQARNRLDVGLPVPSGCQDIQYLTLLRHELPGFLEGAAPPDLVIYNAGNDVLRGDLLGGLDLSPEAVLERDRFVIQQARDRNLPLLFLPSGGYTRGSHKIISRTILETLGSLTPR